MTIAAIRNAATYDWGTWLIGIMRSFISGASSAMVAAMGSIAIDPANFNLSGNLRHTLEMGGIMFLFQGGYRMFEFLQLHGAPDKLQQTLETAAIESNKAVAQANKAADAVAEAKAAAPEKP